MMGSFVEEGEEEERPLEDSLLHAQAAPMPTELERRSLDREQETQAFVRVVSDSLAIGIRDVRREGACVPPAADFFRPCSRSMLFIIRRTTR
jgi:hypothetical protein